MQKYTDTVIKDGKPIAGLTVTVTNYPAGTPATIYAATGGAAVTSVLTDANGRFEFYAPNGHYNITVSGTGINPYTLNDIVLFDPADNGATAVSATGGQNVQTALNSKAPIASPVFTGNVGVGAGTPTTTLQVGGGTGLQQLSISGGGYDLVLGASGGTLFGFASGSASEIFNTANVPLAIGTNGAQPLVFGTAGTYRGGIDASGNLLVGVPSSSNNTIQKAVGQGSVVLTSSSSTAGGVSLAVLGVTGSGYNAANAGVWVGFNGGTNRSINAGGTINASGADYAEYMTKADTCGVIAKGAIVGIDAQGKLTDKWAAAVSFLIKSTDPSYVGGDTWGSEESLGIARPVEPAFEPPKYTGSMAPGAAPADDAGDEDRAAFVAALAAYKADQAAYAATVQTARQQFDTVTVPAYQAQLAVFEAALEAARQKVDRIAFCGQVPVNVTGGTPGQYVVPVQVGDGIGGQLVDAAAVTFDQYRRAVGIVQNVLPDGRANVRVKPV